MADADHDVIPERVEVAGAVFPGPGAQHVTLGQVEDEPQDNHF